MDAGNVSWHYYAPAINMSGGMWSAFQAIKNVRYGPDWSNVINPPQQVLTDIGAGKLANVTWVIPDAKFSDHAGPTGNGGPSWVTSIVNKVGTSKFWNSSAILVTWDDWGGWYDEMPPPSLDFRGLGIRTPLLIISPYAKGGSGSNGGLVTHYQFEPGSILRFIEYSFNLPSLADKYGGGLNYTDKRATGVGVVLDFNQSPRPYGTPIPAQYNEGYFMGLAPSYEAPDDGGGNP